MNDTAAIPARIERLCQQVKECLEMLMNDGQTKLPEPLETCYQRLVNLSYRVLVVGEAKRGKSRFINALIGSDILPTGMDVATAQAFLVQHAAREAYRVRFSDTTFLPIKKEQLAFYGSQRILRSPSIKEEDLIYYDPQQPLRAPSPLDPERIVYCIEVDTPSAFWPLPKSIQILDTPGLGGLFASHAEITQRFVSGAGAAIFMLGSDRPMLQTEVDFVRSILTQTNNILFIQTQIDAYTMADWCDRKNRNEQILRDLFKAEIPVWPLSSNLLMEALQQRNDARLDESGYKQLEPALLAFLAQASGLKTAGQALEAMNLYMRERLEKLWRQEGILEAASGSALHEVYNQLQERKMTFERNWRSGTDTGPKWQEAINRMNAAAGQAELGLYEALIPGGAIETRIHEQIARLKRRKTTSESAQEIAEYLSTAIQETWQQADQQINQECVAIAKALLQADIPNDAADQATAPLLIYQTENDKHARRETVLEFGDELFSLTRQLLTDSTPAEGHYPAHPLSPSAFIFIAASVWAAIRIGLRLFGDQAIKAQLTRGVDEAMQKFRKQLHLGSQPLSQAPLPPTGGPSEITNYIEQRKNRCLNNLRKIIDEQLEDFQAELDLLSQKRKLDQQKRQSQARRLHKQISEWKARQEYLEQIRVELIGLGWRPTRSLGSKHK